MKCTLLVAMAAACLFAAPLAQAETPPPPPPEQKLPSGIEFMRQENGQLGQQISVKTGQISQLLDEIAAIKKRYDDCIADFDKCKAEKAAADKVVADAKAAKEKAEAQKQAMEAAGTKTKDAKAVATPPK